MVISLSTTQMLGLVSWSLLPPAGQNTDHVANENAAQPNYLHMTSDRIAVPLHRLANSLETTNQIQACGRD